MVLVPFAVKRGPRTITMSPTFIALGPDTPSNSFCPNVVIEGLGRCESRLHHRRHDLHHEQFETRDAFADLIHNAAQVPTGRIGHSRCFRMNALARQYVRQAHTRGQDLHPHFTTLRLGALFFNHLQCIRPAVVGYDDSVCLTRSRSLSPYNAGRL